MSTLPLIMTSAGIAAAIAADGQGLQANISEIALGSGSWTPDANATELNSEIKRLTSFGASVIAPDKLHVTIRDDSDDVYELREIGLYLDSGELLAIHAQDTVIVSKSVDAKVLLTAVIPITSVPPSSVTINGNEFDYNPATEEVRGIAEIATQAETDAGTDDEQIVTPLKLTAHLRSRDAVGVVTHTASSAVPDGYLKANGAAYSRTLYAALFAAIGTTFGAGDGSTTFNVPDLRGEFIRGWDDGRGVDLGRVRGSSQSDELRAHDHTGQSTVVTLGAPGNYYNVFTGLTNTGITGGDETRPRNIALLAIIKY